MKSSTKLAKLPPELIKQPPLAGPVGLTPVGGGSPQVLLGAAWPRDWGRLGSSNPSVRQVAGYLFLNASPHHGHPAPAICFSSLQRLSTAAQAFPAPLWALGSRVAVRSGLLFERSDRLREACPGLEGPVLEEQTAVRALHLPTPVPQGSAFPDVSGASMRRSLSGGQETWSSPHSVSMASWS